MGTLPILNTAEERNISSPGRIAILEADMDEYASLGLDVM